MAEDWARPLVHWEIQARDAENLRRFYGEMFNWPIGEGPIMSIPAGVGAESGPAGHIMQGDHPGVSLYIQVLDLAASIEKAKSLGGQALMAPIDIPGGPTVAKIADPEGNAIGLVQQ